MRVFLLFCALCLLAGPILADDVTEAVDEGLAAYKEGKYSEAASSLEYAAALIKEMKGEMIGVVFPPARSGWEKGEVQTSAAAASMFGGGVSASCEYTEKGGDGHLEISVMSDSPYIQALMMAFSNPMIMQADGGKLAKFGGYKARIKYEKKERNGEIGVVVEGKIIVQFDGTDIDEDTLRGYGDELDWKKLKEIADEN